MKTNNLFGPVAAHRLCAGRAALCLLMLSVLLAMAPQATAHPGHDHDHDDHGAVVAPAAPAAALSPETVESNENDIAAVFEQQSIIDSSQNDFDSRIRADFNEIVEVDRPDLQVIDTTAKQQQLFNLSGPGIASPGSDTINIYYVDSISACGTFILEGIVGCGSINGNDIAVESSFAASSFGAELLAHEIGHNLGLLHVGNNNSTNNLMNPRLNNNVALTLSQANSILNNRRVNDDFVNQEHFITVTPIAISDLIVTAVPEPATAGLLMLITAGLALRRPAAYRLARA